VSLLAYPELEGMKSIGELEIIEQISYSTFSSAYTENFFSLIE
jgi:hypothetical protein